MWHYSSLHWHLGYAVVIISPLYEFFAVFTYILLVHARLKSHFSQCLWLSVCVWLRFVYRACVASTVFTAASAKRYITPGHWTASEVSFTSNELSRTELNWTYCGSVYLPLFRFSLTTAKIRKVEHEHPFSIFHQNGKWKMELGQRSRAAT